MSWNKSIKSSLVILSLIAIGACGEATETDEQATTLSGRTTQKTDTKPVSKVPDPEPESKLPDPPPENTPVNCAALEEALERDLGPAGRHDSQSCGSYETSYTCVPDETEICSCRAENVQWCENDVGDSDLLLAGSEIVPSCNTATYAVYNCDYVLQYEEPIEEPNPLETQCRAFEADLENDLGEVGEKEKSCGTYFTSYNCALHGDTCQCTATNVQWCETQVGDTILQPIGAADDSPSEECDTPEYTVYRCLYTADLR